MDRFGAAFGIAFAIEGIFFFLEAIFLAIYIYGWKRLCGWAHFWSGVPMVVTGIGGAFSVVAANSWMNQPQGFTLDAAGKVVDVEPLKVLFNPATGYEVPHMILAAYMVVGFLVASIYAVGMLKGRRDRLHRLGLLIPLTIALHRDPDPALRRRHRGARSRRPPAGQVRRRWSASRKPATDQTEYLGGICTDDGVKGAIGIPGLDSFLVGFSTDTKVTGLERHPRRRTSRPPTRCCTSPSTRWSGSAPRCSRSAPGSPSSGGNGATSRRRRGSCAPSRSPARRRSLALWCGWIVTEVGRQPWIVQGYMRTSEAVTEAEGIWFIFGLVLLLYAALGTDRDPRPALDVAPLARGRAPRDVESPYAPQPEEAWRA